MVIRSMNDCVAVTLTATGARILNDRVNIGKYRVPVGKKYVEGETFKHQLHAIFFDFGGRAPFGELPFSNLRPIVRVTAPSRRV